MKHSTANPFVTALATGAPEAYAALYDRLGPSMLRVARTMLHHSPDAEDAVHDVFVALARNRDRLAQVRDLDAYVFAMLRHAVSRRIERQRTERRHIRELTPPEDTSTDALSAKLAAEYGKGFARTNLFNMIRFAEAFPDEQIVHALRGQLSWTHLRQIIYLPDTLQREFYTQMCRIERWSTRTLQIKIKGMLYERTGISRKPAE